MTAVILGPNRVDTASRVGIARLVVADLGEDSLRPYDAEAADMTEPVEDALALMERALASRDPLELALAGFLSAYKGRTFDKQRRVIKHYVDWCLQNNLGAA